MSKSSYDSALARLLVHEGGYTNHPADPGGPTNFGITIYDYRKYVKPDASAADVRAMQLTEAKEIYRLKYWIANGLNCDDLEPGEDDSLFDYRVNSGTGRADKVLRRVVGLPDNASNAVLLAELCKRDPKQVIVAINAERLRFLQSLRTWPVFGKGWGARVAEVQAFSLQLASAQPPQIPAPTPQIQQAGKGVIPLHPALKAAVDNKKIIAQGGGAAGAGGGLGAWDWIKAHPAEATALGAGIVGGVAVVGYAIERWHRSHQEAATPGLTPVPQKAAA